MGIYLSRFLSNCGEPIEPIVWNPTITLHSSYHSHNRKRTPSLRNFLTHAVGNLIELTPGRCKIQRVQLSLSTQNFIDKRNFQHSKQVVTVHYYDYRIGNSVDCYDPSKLTGLSLHKIFTHFPSLIRGHLDLTSETTRAVLWATQFRYTVQIPLIQDKGLNIYYLYVTDTNIRKRMK